MVDGRFHPPFVVESQDLVHRLDVLLPAGRRDQNPAAKDSLGPMVP